ncbi:MAG: hypothetical protein EZS28_017099 [Streblomastix strix]|uniref:Activator of Hsp90 ATPase AHSA1-like N-terminal domain-containing protein n=1 Tax=Streblomastix strix TaxID=222440 RepID=A0A5J4VXC8_9EUKA|nr:MAG: hypothetical protein EZS28_017099 [Streblomastix strix]
MSVWNVNQWHWEERPQTQWAKERIPELLAELEFPFEDGSIKVPKVDKIEGDAVINVRKGKRILVFELNISASWEGKVGQILDRKTGSGKISLPYVCEDVDDRNFRIEITADNANEETVRMKEVVVANKDKIVDKIKQWVTELENRQLQ